MPSYDLHGYLGKQQLSLLMAAFLLTLKERGKKKKKRKQTDVSKASGKKNK